MIKIKLIFTLCYWIIFSSCGNNSITQNTNNDSKQSEKTLFSKHLEENKTSYSFVYPNAILEKQFGIPDSNRVMSFFLKNKHKIKEWNDDFQNQISEDAKYIYICDINGDGEDEFIYQGPSGMEENMIAIYLNSPDSLFGIFEGMQEIYDIKFENNKLSHLSIHNFGCCMDQTVVNYFYKVNFENLQPKFALTKVEGYIKQFDSLQHRFEDEKYFTIRSPKTQLRNNCFELNTEYYYYPQTGNLIYEYPKGSSGKALGKNTLKDGSVWYYVKMEGVNANRKPYYWQTFDNKIELYGWLQAKEIHFQ